MIKSLLHSGYGEDPDNDLIECSWNCVDQNQQIYSTMIVLLKKALSKENMIVF